MASVGAQSSRRVLSSPFRQDSIEDDCEDYGADRHAAAALRGLSAPLKSLDQHSSGSSASPHSHAASSPEQKTVKKKRIYKKRKATHTVRKEEKQQLEIQLEMLQKQLQELKMKTIMEQDEKEFSQRKRQAKRELLREAVQEQHLVLARAHAMLAGHNQETLHRLHPTELKIRLGTDRNLRIRTLAELRETKLREGRRFLMERTRGLDPTAPYYQEERYDTLDGDYCIARFDVTQFRGVRGGVEEVFAAIKQTAFNAEIIISETSGNITIREDDELGEEEKFSQMRLASSTPLGVQIETNLVLFSDFSQCHANTWNLAEDGRYAIMASDFVDDDELYPYRSHERLRRDSTSVMMITSFLERKDRTTGVKTEGDGELVVVVTRWALTKVRHPAFDISRTVWEGLREAHGRWADLMYHCVRQALGLPVAP